MVELHTSQQSVWLYDLGKHVTNLSSFALPKLTGLSMYPKFPYSAIYLTCLWSRYWRTAVFFFFSLGVPTDSSICSLQLTLEVSPESEDDTCQNQLEYSRILDKVHNNYLTYTSDHNIHHAAVLHQWAKIPMHRIIAIHMQLHNTQYLAILPGHRINDLFPFRMQLDTPSLLQQVLPTLLLYTTASTI